MSLRARRALLLAGTAVLLGVAWRAGDTAIVALCAFMLGTELAHRR